jgi:dihydroorotase
MVEALSDGLIDVIGSHHTPQDEEEKRLPFEEAASGAVGLETLLPRRCSSTTRASRCAPWRALSLNPRACSASTPVARAGAPPDLVLFDPDAPSCSIVRPCARSPRTRPYDLRRMQGRVLRTWVAGREVYSRS